MKYKGFESRTVLITGASKGIGRALALELAETDCNLILTASSMESFHGFDVSGENISLIPFDMSDRSSLEPAIQQIKSLKTQPDIIINNAGIGIFKPFKDFKSNDLDRTMDINFRTPFMLTQSLLTNMLSDKFGIIANILSVAATTNFAGSSVYSASKSALLEAMKTLRLEHRKDGIKVINFLPGATSTSIWNEKILNEMGNKMMKPESLAKTIISTINSSIASDLTIEEMLIRPVGGDL